MSKELKILHVDDSRAILMYTQAMLKENLSIKITDSAGTVSGAKQYLGCKGADIVILDINLPDGNGISLLTWIKQEYPATIVIMFTNHSEPFMRNHVKNLGADYFADKSMEFEDLLTILSDLSGLTSNAA